MGISVKRRVKSELYWMWLKGKALSNGISISKLSRVKDYLDQKTGIKKFESENAYQKPAQFFPGLSHRPFYDIQQFEWARKLEAAADDVTSEFKALYEAGLFRPQAQKLLDRGDWNTYYLNYYGMRYDEHCAACPITASLMDDLAEDWPAGGTYFSMMSPDTHVKPHCGPTNTTLRCHLGLVIPEGAAIRVETEKVYWQEKQCIVFDESFEHEVWNTSGERAVLIMDFWHPELSREERWALNYLGQVSGRNKAYRKNFEAKRTA
ncbi:MAG: aspartyl/asparaginyl beta-hydroxylase domain-containing protein [Pseudomonadota bacterium]